MKRPTQRLTCRDCGRHRDEVGPMSHTGKCPDCGERALIDNIVGLMNHSGPAFERWRVAMARSVGAITVDELQDAERLST